MHHYGVGHSFEFPACGKPWTLAAIFTMRILIIISIVLLTNAGFFHSNDVISNLPTNDTTEVIKMCIKKAFYKNTLPDLSFATRKYKFGDSILLTSERLPLRYLPVNVDSIKFKIMKRSEIRSLLLADSNWERQPNYLCINNFEKTNDKYEVIIVSLSGGKYYSGGGLHIFISKESDSLRITNVKGFSIN